VASSTGSLSALLDPGYRMVFFQWIREHPWEYTEVFNVMDSERAYEEDIIFSGLGAVPEKAEGASVLYDDPIQGAAVRYTHRVYSLGFRVTREMYDDDLYGVVKKVVTALARSAKHTMETIAWDILNDAFSNTRVGEDGIELCSTAHTMLNGGTQSNRPSTDIDLSVTGLEQAIDNFERQTDHRGLPMAVTARWVVIPPERKWKAREILNSAQRSDTADNATNALKEEDLSYYVSHYLDSSTAWYVLSAKDEHDLKFYKRDGIEMASADDFDGDQMKSKVRFRCCAGHTVWQGVWGSPGGAG
jgi:phage major head subunit gpT-like protein